MADPIKLLDMQKIEVLWSPQVHRGIFWGDSGVIVIFGNGLILYVA